MSIDGLTFKDGRRPADGHHRRADSDGQIDAKKEHFSFATGFYTT